VPAEKRDRSLANMPLSRTDWAASELRQAILRGDLAPGERLIVADLSARWAVSQTPLREAFERLVMEGLVERESNRGVRVAPLSAKDLSEIYEMRLLLDPLALERSINNANDDWRRRTANDFAELTAVLKKSTRFENPDELEAFEDKHTIFHRTLRSNCDSELLLRMIEMITASSVRYRLLSYNPRGGASALLREHKTLYELAMAGDASKAAELNRKHLQRAYDDVLAEVERRSRVGDRRGDRGRSA
jgi:GntR family transcriptional regulator, carbon starvation induced regulator